MTVEIDGTPIYAGRILTPSDPLFASLRTVADYKTLASKIRGQFAVIVQDGPVTTAVTDFGGAFPVFYIRDAGRYRLSFRLGRLNMYSARRVSKPALFFRAARGGLGMDPLYADVRQVPPATVARFEGAIVSLLPYVNWGDCLTEAPLNFEDARNTFLALCAEYIAAISNAGSTVACLMSSGTDSALMAWMLKRQQVKAVCLTADYSFKRYSEFSLASEHARRIGLEHFRVLVSRRDHRRAFLRMNTLEADMPSSHSQLTSFYALAQWAAKQGIQYLFTGDNFDSLFLGVEQYFAGLPQNTSEYLKVTDALTTAARVERLTRWPRIGQTGQRLLADFGCEKSECERWVAEATHRDSALLSQWAQGTPFWRLQQIRSQIWKGVPWQNSFLPAQRAIGCGVQFVSPLASQEMVRFALSLPFRFKFDDGVTKVFLRSILERETGIRVARCNSPNPSRVWSLVPAFQDALKMDQRLRSTFLWYSTKNLFKLGGLHEQVSSTAALGTWLRAHRLGDVES